MNKQNKNNKVNKNTKTITVKVNTAENAETGEQTTPVENTTTTSKRVKKYDKPGRPRSLFSRVIAFVVKEDGSIMRRTKGKPNSKFQIKFYSVDWNYKGSTLPENAVEVAKPEKKIKIKQPVLVEGMGSESVSESESPLVEAA